MTQQPDPPTQSDAKLDAQSDEPRLDGTVPAAEAVAHDRLAETLGPHDVVDVKGLDEQGVPRGEHVLACGCQMQGRALIQPCVAHAALVQAPASGLVIAGADALNQGQLCTKCGTSMPPMSEEMRKLIRAAGGNVALAHEVCPGEAAKGPEGRYFELRCQVVEVTERYLGPFGDGVGDREPRVDAHWSVDAEELITFITGHRAPDLDTAMRPLALAFGEKWQLAEKQAKLADGDPLAAM